jgi:hypothetical protein
MEEARNMGVLIHENPWTWHCPAQSADGRGGLCRSDPSRKRPLIKHWICWLLRVSWWTELSVGCYVGAGTQDRIPGAHIFWERQHRRMPAFVAEYRTRSSFGRASWDLLHRPINRNKMRQRAGWNHDKSGRTAESYLSVGVHMRWHMRGMKKWTSWHQPRAEGVQIRPIDQTNKIWCRLMQMRLWFAMRGCSLVFPLAKFICYFGLCCRTC